MVDGLNICDEKNFPNPLISPVLVICDACELGTPIEHKQKYIRNKATDSLACIHVDTFQNSPEGLNNHKYGMILTDEATSGRWGYTFSTKNTTFQCLKDFSTYAQTQ